MYALAMTRAGWAGLLGALLAGAGVCLIVIPPRSRATRVGRRSLQRTAAALLERASLAGVRPTEIAGAIAGAATVGAAAGFVLFGTAPAVVAAGALAAGLPVSMLRARHDKRVAEARAAWPRLLEELRLLACSAGRSVPQALFEVGRRAPDEMRPAFSAAEREWMLSTDFRRTADTLKAGLRDATADAVCETLVVAHELGGAELDARLAALVEDRLADLDGRRDAQSRQAGARFARIFVLLVPLGMTLAGLSIGAGRSSYGSPGGELAVVVGLAVVAGCWAWAGRLMRLPSEPRVFG
jgi:tight adherence protein B